MTIRPLLFLLLLAPLAVALAGCGGGSQSFADCGNGRLDTGEICDDGNLADTDACTSACQPARCGDGVVEIGVEDCDGRELDNGSCAAVGRSGNPICDGQCHFDYSPCGDILTPTGTATATPTITPTPTETLPPTPAPPTATPTPTQPSQCGDGLLNNDESCDSCASDCMPRPCTPSGASVPVPVSVSLPGDTPVKSLTVTLAYRTTELSLPSGNIQTRVSAAADYQARATKNTGYSVDVILMNKTSGDTVQSGPVFAITLDTCSGAAPPRNPDLACRVTACSSAVGCTCTAAMP